MAKKKSKRKTTRRRVDDEAEVKRLIARYKKGHQKAFSELVNRYHGQVASLAYKMVNDYDEAADIAQEVFVKMSKNIDRFDENKRFYTWLYRVTVNASIDFIRKHKRHRHESLESFQHTIESFNPTPDVLYRHHLIAGCINDATRTLNNKQQSAFLLGDVQGRKINEVAQILDMPAATVRWYLHRARLKIRNELWHRCPRQLIMSGIK